MTRGELAIGVSIVTVAIVATWLGTDTSERWGEAATRLIYLSPLFIVAYTSLRRQFKKRRVPADRQQGH